MFKAFRHATQKRKLLKSLGSFDEQALFLATSQGHIDWVTLLIDKGISANSRDDDGATPLIKAAAAGQLAMVELLVETGAALNLQDHLSESALMKAATHAHTEVLQCLLTAGAEVDLRDEEGGTALMKAIDAGNTGIIRALLKAGADPNLVDKSGKHVLHHAAFSPSLCKILEGAGAQLPAKKKQNRLYESVEQAIPKAEAEIASWLAGEKGAPWGDKQLEILREIVQFLTQLLQIGKDPESSEAEFTASLEYIRLLAKMLVQLKEMSVKTLSIFTSVYQESKLTETHPRLFFERTSAMMEEMDDFMQLLMEKSEANHVKNS